MDWSNVLSDAIGTYGNVEIAKANNGATVYQQGQPYTAPTMAGINPVWLIAGATVLAFVILRD